MSILFKRIFDRKWGKTFRATTGASVNAPGIAYSSILMQKGRELAEKYKTMLSVDIKPTIGWLLALLGLTDIITNPITQSTISGILGWLYRYNTFLSYVEGASITPDQRYKLLLEIAGYPPPSIDRFLHIFARFYKRSPAKILTTSALIFKMIADKLGVPELVLLQGALLERKAEKTDNDRKLLEEIERAIANYIYSVIFRSSQINIMTPSNAEKIANDIIKFLSAIAFGDVNQIISFLIDPTFNKYMEMTLGTNTWSTIKNIIGKYVESIVKMTLTRVSLRGQGKVKFFAENLTKYLHLLSSPNRPENT